MIAGIYGKCMFRFFVSALLRKLPHFFLKGLYYFIFPPGMCERSKFSAFLSAFAFHISLVTNVVENLFICISAFHILFSVKYLMSFAHLKLDFCFLVLSMLRLFHIF